MQFTTIKNPKGFGFENIKFFDHALIQASATLKEESKDKNSTLTKSNEQPVLFIGVTKPDAIQRIFEHLVNLHQSVLADWIEKNGNPYKIDINAISESLWHAPIGFECFFQSAWNKLDLEDQINYKKHAESVARFIQEGVAMTEEISNKDEYESLWRNIREAEFKMDLTRAEFPSKNPNNVLVLKNVEVQMLKRDEHSFFIDLVNNIIQDSNENEIHHNLKKAC